MNLPHLLCRSLRQWTRRWNASPLPPPMQLYKASRWRSRSQVTLHHSPHPTPRWHPQVSKLLVWRRSSTRTVSRRFHLPLNARSRSKREPTSSVGKRQHFWAIFSYPCKNVDWLIAYLEQQQQYGNIGVAFQGYIAFKPLSQWLFSYLFIIFNIII